MTVVIAPRELVGLWRLLGRLRRQQGRAYEAVVRVQRQLERFMRQLWVI